MNGAITGGQLNDNAKFASFFRFTRTSGTSVAAPSDNDFETEFGRAPLENDQLVVTNTAPTPDTQAAYLRNGSSAWVSVSDFIAGNLIVDGSIGADQIIANSIGADEIQVTNLAAIQSDLGAVTAGSIDINNVFTVTDQGALTATSATITGDITAENLNVTNATVTGSFVASNLPNLENLNGAVTDTGINVATLAAITADLGAITAGSISNSTNSPTAGSAPTGSQSGTAINLASGSFTFGDALAFLYFNTTDGLVQGGLTPFNDSVSIYYQGSSAPSSPSDSSMTYSTTGAYSFTTNPPTGWTLGIPNTTDNIYVVQADIGRIGAGLTTASWGQVSLLRAATVTETSLSTSPSSIAFFYANSGSTGPNSYSNTYTVTASGAYSHSMITNAGPQAGTWNSLASGSVTPNEQSGDTGQFTISSVTYQASSFMKTWSWTVTHTASGSTVSQSTRSMNPSNL